MSNTIQLMININADNATRVVDELTKNLSNLGDTVKVGPTNALVKFDDVATRIGFRLQGFMNMFNVFKGTLGDWINESNEGEQASTKLSQSLRLQGMYSENLIANIKEYAAERQALTGIDDDATIAIAAQFTAMGLQGKALRDAIDSAQDLSAVMGVDLTTAARLVGNSMKDGGEELKRYGFNLSDIRGQSVALGSDGAGGIKKFEADLNDLKQTFGDMLKNILLPFVSLGSSVLKFFTEGGPVAHTFAFGVTALGIAFAFLNTSMGGTPYIIGAILTGVVVLVQWLDSISEKNNKLKQTSNSSAIELDNLSAAIARLRKEAGNSSEIDELQKKVDALRNPKTESSLIADYEQAQKKVSDYQKQLADGENILNKVLALEKQGKDVRTENSALAQEYFRIFSDGSKDEQTQLKEIADKQTAATKAMKEAEVALLTFQQNNNNVQLQLKKNAIERDIDDVNRAKETLSQKLDNEEKTKLATATTAEQKRQIENEFAKRRIELESATTIKVIELNKKILDAQISAAQKSKANPKVIADLRAQLAQLDKDIEAAKNNASLKKLNADLDQSGKDAERQRTIDSENKQLNDEIAIEQRRRAEREKSKSFADQIATSYIDTLLAINDAEKKLADDVKKYEAEKDATKREALKKIIDQDKQEIEMLDAKAAAQKEATVQQIQAGVQSYDANKNLGVQVNQMVNQQIRAFIAKSVMEYLATMIGFFGPLAPILAPAAGLALQAILERLIPKFAMGGDVPGTGDTDSVLALLTPGEKIMRKSVNQKHGAFLDALNAGVAYPSQQVIVQSSSQSDTGLFVMLKKEMRNLGKKMKQEIFIESNFDVQKYKKANDKMNRTKAAFAL